MQKLQALLVMLKAAKAPSRELDCRVWCATAGKIDYDLALAVVPNLYHWIAPHYTQSLDDALSLIDATSRQSSSYDPTQGHSFGFSSKFCRGEGVGVTASLAVCIAVIEHQIKMLEVETV